MTPDELWVNVNQRHGMAINAVHATASAVSKGYGIHENRLSVFVTSIVSSDIELVLPDYQQPAFPPSLIIINNKINNIDELMTNNTSQIFSRRLASKQTQHWGQGF